ncbi:MAG: NAD-dependent protein deacylase [Mycoplasmatales bacterium]
MDNIIKLKKIIDEAEKIVFFGGAGTSTESNIPDFRSSKGVYNQNFNKLSPEVILSHDFFYQKPEMFYRFLKEKIYHPQAEPHFGHLALVELEKLNKLSAIITQNIDGLHQKAGSTNVIELHGTIYENYCINCQTYFPLDYIIDEGYLCNECEQLIKPKVVLYGEPLDDEIVKRAISVIEHADTLIICGTSLSVYPAANFIQYFNGKNLVIINYEELNVLNNSQLLFKMGFGETFHKLAQINQDVSR